MEMNKSLGKLKKNHYCFHEAFYSSHCVIK